jgi:1-acyl-sn-glycerol-3-phosphate acyltransferase
MPILRGILFTIGFWLGIAVHSVITSLMSPFISQRKRYDVAAKLTRFIDWWLKISCGITYRVEGSENIIQTPAVIVSNHQSAWETFMIQHHFDPLCPVMKKELTRIPFFGWSLRLVNPIAIDRSRKQNALKQVITQGVNRLQNGQFVMIFPEGTRVAPGQVVPHFAGGSLLAIKAQVPIVPLVHNSGQFWPARKLAKYPGVITLKIGAPIDTHGKDAKTLTQDIEAWIRQEEEKLPRRQ